MRLPDEASCSRLPTQATSAPECLPARQNGDRLQSSALALSDRIGCDPALIRPAASPPSSQALAWVAWASPIRASIPRGRFKPPACRSLRWVGDSEDRVYRLIRRVQRPRRTHGQDAHAAP